MGLPPFVEDGFQRKVAASLERESYEESDFLGFSDLVPFACYCWQGPLHRPGKCFQGLVPTALKACGLLVCHLRIRRSVSFICSLGLSKSQRGKQKISGNGKWET